MMSPWSHRFVAVAAPLALAASTLAPSPAQAAPALPLLWEGTVLTAAGAPAAATVTAYARPAADQIEVGLELTPVASTTTDGRGRFQLRALPAALAPVADVAGWGTVMVVASNADGMALAVDSVAWKATGALRSALGGAWVSTPAALFSAGPKAPIEAAEDLARERPPVLTLSERKPVEEKGSDAGLGTARPPKGHGRCVAVAADDMDGTRLVQVGELHRERAWAGEFTYTNTRSSSVQIGVSNGHGGWSVGGSTSRDQASTIESGGGEAAQAAMVYRRYFAEMVFTQFTWRCGEPYWYDLDTLEPTRWIGGIDPQETGTPAACDRRWTATVGAGRYFLRADGASSTYREGVNAYGFSGSVTTTNSSTAKARWVNEAPVKRQVCGDVDYPDGHTRVVSLP